MKEVPMTNAVQMNKVPQLPSYDAIEKVLMTGDLSALSAEQRVVHYNRVCDLLHLNPTTKPFDYITLNGKLVLYANKGCAEQLRANWRISIQITNRQTIEGVYIVTARATSSDGREDESTGAVPIQGVKGEALANAMMKAETKAKRRVTLSICGLNMLDDSEIESIRNQQREQKEVPSTQGPSLNARVSPKAAPKVEIEVAAEQGIPVVKGEDHQPWETETPSAVIPPVQDAGIDGEDMAATTFVRGKFAGKRFDQIARPDLESYGRWMYATGSKDPKGFNREWSELIPKIATYLGVSIEG